jgi:transcription factor-like protein
LENLLNSFLEGTGHGSALESGTAGQRVSFDTSAGGYLNPMLVQIHTLLGNALFNGSEKSSHIFDSTAASPSLFNAVLSSTECAPLTRSLNYDAADAGYKHEATKTALLALLPPKADLLEYIRQGNNWWLKWNRNLSAPYQKEHATFEAFAVYTLAEGTPIEAAILLMCFASGAHQTSFSVKTSVDQDYLLQISNTICRLIVGDDLYMDTIQGLECSLLLGKFYADIGHLRKAWSSFHRGICCAVLIGLHKRRCTPIQERIWWGLYQFDRFCSLILRLPYGIPDSYCNFSFEGRDLRTEETMMGFTAGLAQISSNIIDHSQSLNEDISQLMIIDYRLTELAIKTQPLFWDATTATFMSSKERLLTQMLFYQARLILHIPYMLKAIDSRHKYQHSWTICYTTAYTCLQIYQKIQAHEGASEAMRGFDLVGYMSSVIVAIQLLQRMVDRQSHIQTPTRDSEDNTAWSMVHLSIEIFQRNSKEKGGGLAVQFRQGLQQLVSLSEPTSGSVTAKEVNLPYFGTIRIPHSQIFELQSNTTTLFTDMPPVDNTRNAAAMNTPSDTHLFHNLTDPFTSYDDLYAKPLYPNV